ncbi:transmembrane protein, putative [Medicago truncatula]|uniref:Transmembrane protein, putative n=1 Tax=Medicago truncatula TaxID=3880 RepID=G7L7D5_MEDTR|nr:transmembrane protein, putative [Medicago truncatula]
MYVHVLSVASEPLVHDPCGFRHSFRKENAIHYQLSNKAEVVMVYAYVISTWLLIHVVSIMAFEKEFSQVKKWEKWVVRIQEIFGLQRLLEKIQSGIQKEEEKASCEKSMKGDKKALFKIHESVDKANSEERDNKALFLVHKMQIRAWKAQRGVVSSKALQGAEEERSDQERNMEMEGKHNENHETGSETEEEEEEQEFSLGCEVYAGEVKNPRKRGSITIKRVRSNYASKMDMGAVVSSDKGDCVIKTFMWITRSAMKAFVQSYEEKVTELAQEGVEFMRGIVDIFRFCS